MPGREEGATGCEAADVLVGICEFSFESLVHKGEKQGIQLRCGFGLQALEHVHLRLPSARETMTEGLHDSGDAFFGHLLRTNPTPQPRIAVDASSSR